MLNSDSSEEDSDLNLKNMGITVHWYVLNKLQFRNKTTWITLRMFTLRFTFFLQDCKHKLLNI